MVDFDFKALPSWALPVGIGGLVGAVVLFTRKGGNTTSTTLPLPIQGQNAGSGASGIDALITSLFGSLSEQQGETLTTVGTLLAEQAIATEARFGGFFDMITEQNRILQDTLGDILELETEGPSTALPTLIDKFRERFSTAFQRVGDPFGDRVPNSDIILNEKNDLTFYTTTGHGVTGAFRNFLGNRGGARTWGRPLSQVFRDSDGRDTQVFENAIFKLIPGAAPDDFDIIVIPLV